MAIDFGRDELNDIPGADIPQAFILQSRIKTGVTITDLNDMVQNIDAVVYLRNILQPIDVNYT